MWLKAGVAAFTNHGDGIFGFNKRQVIIVGCFARNNLKDRKITFNLKYLYTKGSRRNPKTSEGGQ